MTKHLPVGKYSIRLHPSFELIFMQHAAIYGHKTCFGKYDIKLAHGGVGINGLLTQVGYL